jgi:thioredoxin 1
MTTRRLILAALLAVAPWTAQALEIAPYSDAALAASQKAGKPVALHFHADWCSTCRAQQKSLNALRSEPGLDVTVLVANFDNEKALKQQLGVRSQSTLIVFRGSEEKARLAGETSAERLRAALKTAL